MRPTTSEMPLTDQFVVPVAVPVAVAQDDPKLQKRLENLEELIVKVNDSLRNVAAGIDGLKADMKKDIAGLNAAAVQLRVDMDANQTRVKELGDLLNNVRADVTFLGTNCISVRHGLSTPDSSEAAAKRAMAAAARQVVVLADSSKIGRESTISFAALAQVDVVVTDDGISEADHKALVDADVQVVVA